MPLTTHGIHLLRIRSHLPEITHVFSYFVQETAHHVEHVKKALPTLPHPSLPTLTLRHSKDEKAEKAGPTTAEGAVEMTDAAWKKAVHETRPPTQAGGSVDQGPIPPGLGHAETDATVDLTPQGACRWREVTIGV